MQAWRVHRHGPPSDVLVLEQTESPTPGPGEVRVRVDATTLNFNDIDGIYGRYRTVAPPLPYTPGMEVLGHVDACGDGTERWLDRRVVATPTGAFGGYAESVIAPAVMTFAMPDELDVAAAAAIYFPFHLSWLALVERGRLRRGETVLVHAAAGGIGSAAVQLGAHVGAPRDRHRRFGREGAVLPRTRCRRRDQLPAPATSATPCSTPPTDAGSTSRSTPSAAR